MTKELVIHNGVKVTKDWPKEIEKAQKETTINIAGVTYHRIRFGFEAGDWGANKGPCHDCAVVKGQLHVNGCDVERCPLCSGQLISCDCNK